MIMKRMALIGLALGMACGAAAAQDGYVGLSFGTMRAYEVDLNQTENGSFASLDGFYRWQLGAGSLGLEFSLGQDNGGYDPLALAGGGELGRRYFAALHYALPINDRATVTGFYGYGRAPHGGGNQEYALVYGGIGGTYLVNDSVLI